MSNISVFGCGKINYLLNTFFIKKTVPISFKNSFQKWIQFDIDYAPNDINIVEISIMTH